MTKQDVQTDQIILEAARKVFQRSGFGGARMQEIADEAGINKASLHYYYRSKNKLFQTVFREDIQLFLVPLVGILRDPSLSLEVRIRTFVGSYIKTLTENPGLPLFIMQELSSNPGRLISLLEQNVPGIGDRYDEASAERPDGEHGVRETMFLGVFIRQIRHGMESGELNKVDPEQYILSMISMCVFPFVGRPMIRLLLGKDEQEYRDFLMDRESEIIEYLLRVLFKDYGSRHAVS